MASGKSGSIWASLGLQTKDFEKGMDKAKGQVRSFGTDIVKSTAGALAGAFAVQSIVAFGAEAAELAGKMEGVEAAFKRIDNGNLFQSLREATKGTVDDLTLMQSAVQAQNLGLPVQKLGTYFEFARRTAKATGESVDYLVDSIVKGIGRKSPLILDNLGISTTQLNEELKKTPDFATAVSNIIEQKMGAVGEDIETAAERTARLNAEWTNTKITLGEVINKGLAPFQTELGKTAVKLNTLLDTTSNDNWTKVFSSLSNSIVGVNVPIKSFDNSLASILDNFRKLNLEQLESKDGMLAFSKSMVAMGLTTQQALEKWKQLRAEKKRALNPAPIIRTVSLINEEIKAQQQMLELTADRAGAMAIQERIGKLEKEKEGILGSSKALKAQNKELEDKAKKLKEIYDTAERENRNFDLIGSELSFDWNDFEVIGKPEDVFDFSGMEMPDFYAELDKSLDGVNEKAQRVRDGLINSANAINAAFSNIAVEGLATFGAALGTAFAGGDVMQIGMQFASVIADAIGGLGKNLIEIGIVMTGIIETLKSGGFANPALLIGGGVALVALSSAMKGMIGNSVGFANGGLVTGSVFANIGEGIGTNSANPEVIAPLDKLKNFINPNQGGVGGGDVKFRIEGNSLVGILDRESKNTKYSR